MPFTTGGFAAELDRMDTLAKFSGVACEAAVKVGAKILVQKLQKAAPVRTGALGHSIKAGRITYSGENGFFCEIAPTGNRPEDGEAFAKIGNIVEYGRQNMPANAWFNPSVALAEKEVQDAMQAEFDKRIEGAM